MSSDSESDHEERELSGFERRTQSIFYAPKFSPNDDGTNSWCHFKPINPDGFPFQIVDTTTLITPPTPKPICIPRSPHWYRDAILGAAERLVGVLPKPKRPLKKRKAPAEATGSRKRPRDRVTFSPAEDSNNDEVVRVPEDISQATPTKSTPTKKRKASPDLPKGRKRPTVDTLFTIAEDSDAEEIARVPQSAANITTPETESLVSAKPIKKLEAFNYKAIPVANRSPGHTKLSTKFETLQNKHDFTSTLDETRPQQLASALFLHSFSHLISGSEQDPLEGHIVEEKPSNLIEIIEETRRRQESPIIISPSDAENSDNASDAAHLDGHIVGKNRQQLRKLAKKPGRCPKNSRIAFSPKMADAHQTPPLDLSIDLSEDAFEEDDSIFDELIANDEAEIRLIIGATTANEVYSDQLSTLTPLPFASAKPLPSSSPTGTAINNHYHQAKPFNPPKPPLKPTFRSVLPTPTPTSSLIPSLTPNARVITCFRIAEALRLLSPTIHTPFRAIELYAVVLASSRSNADKTQTFQFADLYFPQRPPYLQGTFAAYASSEYCEEDSSAFLSTSADPSAGQGERSEVKLCRAIIRPAQTSTMPPQSVRRRSSRGGEFSSSQNSMDGTQRVREGNGSGTGAAVEILNIWKADWDDVQHVRGIVLEDDT